MQILLEGTRSLRQDFGIGGQRARACGPSQRTDRIQATEDWSRRVEVLSGAAGERLVDILSLSEGMVTEWPQAVLCSFFGG